jgi:predicted AAA+ superfamily ATPase
LNKIIDRTLRINLPARQSAFLWGPRKTGKSTLLKTAFPGSVVYDFLKTELVIDLSKRPSLLREQLLAKRPQDLEKPVILDEVQKVPTVLDEVQWLIENRGLRFILCGSSARKLKRGKANLLGGRAWRYELFRSWSPPTCCACSTGAWCRPTTCRPTTGSPCQVTCATT